MTALERHLRTLTDRELVKRLRIVRGQIPRAWESRNDAAMERLQTDDAGICAERMRRLLRLP